MINSWIDGWFESQLLSICKKNASDGISGKRFFIQSFVCQSPSPLVHNSFR